MKKITLVAFLLSLLPQGAAALPADLPAITHYSLRIRLFPAEKRLEAEARMAITNKAEEAKRELPFLLYRLLDVESCTGENEASLHFTQQVTKVADLGPLQANWVTVQLARPLAPGDSTQLSLRYRGSLFGYREVFSYVRDTVSEEYSLLRPDALAYPMLALPSWESMGHAYRQRFTYDLQITVPADYLVATGGLLEEIPRPGDTLTFGYRSKVPAWRIDIAAAKFKVFQDEENHLYVYALPGHEQGAANVLQAMKRAVAFFTAMFGAVKGYQGYTAIEIPDGWGSQASDFYFLQTAAAFTDSQRISEVYHEIAHTWNAKAKPEVQRARWFDEAFASYFEALAVREFEGQKAFEEKMEAKREIFVRETAKDKANLETPLAEYGKYELGGLSYTKGSWSLYVLHELVGEEEFKQIIRTFLQEFRQRPADFPDFRRAAERASKKDLSKYFSDWFYGSESSRMLAEAVPVRDIVARYQ